MNTKRIALAVLGSLAALSAQAFQGEQNPLPPPPFQSSLARAQVQQRRKRRSRSATAAPACATDRPGRPRRGACRRAAVAANGAATYGELSARGSRRRVR